MQRRSFIKHLGAAGLLVMVTPTGIVYASRSDRQPALENGFYTPPLSAKPLSWWHWMNGNISRQGITKDLESMKAIGLGGFQLFSESCGIPKGPVDYHSAEWIELLKHAIRESERLGLEFHIHNAPGWSSTGGPWVTEEHAMKQVTWSEMFINGGDAINTDLSQPFTRRNYYRDIKVLAFPSLQNEGAIWHQHLVKLSSAEGPIPRDRLTGFNAAGVKVLAESEKKPGFLLLEFSVPLEAQSVLLYARAEMKRSGGGFMPVSPVTLEASDDGISFRKIFVIKRTDGGSPGAGSFNAVKARYFRFSFPVDCYVEQLALHGGSRLPNWASKANYYLSDAYSRGEITLVKDIISSSNVVDITGFMNAKGRLAWKAPEGKWTILRMGYTVVGRDNRAAPDQGHGLECDKFSKEAFSFHFDAMFREVMPAMKEMARNGTVAMLIDSYEVGMQNWTSKFLDDFKERRPYDLVKLLPALTGRVMDSEEITERFLWDFRRVQADLMADNYYGHCARLCRDANIVSYTEPYNNGPFNQMQAGARMDFAIGEFYVITRRFLNATKLAASIQHTNGKKVVGGESYTGDALFSKWQEHPYALKTLGDLIFTKGLNRMIFQCNTHQSHPTAAPGMTMGPHGIHFDRMNTWWEPGRAWVQYISRCQWMLQQGLFVADLLYFCSETAPGDDIAARITPLPAPPQGYDYDDLHVDTLLNSVHIENNRIVLPDGMSYTMLVMPLNCSITIEALRKIHSLLNQGMVVMGTAPVKVEGLSGYPKNQEEGKLLCEMIWGRTDVKYPEGKKVGKGIVFISNKPAEILAKLNTPQDFFYTSRNSDAAIHYIHRRDGDTDIYFIANLKRRDEEVVCSLRITGKKPEIWNAETGTIIPADAYTFNAGRVQIPLSFTPSGSLFIVFRQKAGKDPLLTIRKDNQVVFSANLFPASKSGLHKQLVDNFSISTWIKPDYDIAIPGYAFVGLLNPGPKSFVFYPSNGDELYEKGHTIAGVVAGRNGIVVYERSQEKMNPVLICYVPVSGWVHLVLVYKQGIPSVYLNGRLLNKGKKSAEIVHPAIGDERYDFKASFFEGEMDTPRLFETALDEEKIKELAGNKREESLTLPVLEYAGKDTSAFLLFRNGRYEFERASGKVSEITVNQVVPPLLLKGPWRLRFTQQKGSVPDLTLTGLISLHTHKSPDVKYFSGTVTYTNSFMYMLNKSFKRRIFLDLGEVEVMAEVILNGKNLGILWKKPYRVDITDTLKEGNNKLNIKVTNRWINRLIGDEQLPEEHEYGGEAFSQKGAISSIPEWYIKGKPIPGNRKAFSTWKLFDKESPLVASGLVGPVNIVVAVFISNKRQIKI